jgi:hypothetical protein
LTSRDQNDGARGAFLAACSRCTSAFAHARSRMRRVAYRGFQMTGLGTG